MNPEDVIASLEREFLAEARDDFVGIWEIEKQLESLLPAASDDEKQSAGREVVRRLMSAGLVLGTLNGDGFVRWSRKDGLDEVMRIWKSNGRLPGFEDAWLG